MGIRNSDRGARVQLFVHSETDRPPAVGVPRCVTNSRAHYLTAPMRQYAVGVSGRGVHWPHAALIRDKRPARGPRVEKYPGGVG